MPADYSWNNSHPYWTPGPEVDINDPTAVVPAQGDSGTPPTPQDNGNQEPANDQTRGGSLGDYIKKASFLNLNKSAESAPPEVKSEDVDVVSSRKPAAAENVVLVADFDPAAASLITAPSNSLIAANGLVENDSPSDIDYQDSMDAATPGMIEASGSEEGSVLAANAVSLGDSAQIPVTAFFNDPYLLSLIQQAMSGNQELRILAEEIRIACNETYARSGEYRPFVTLGGSAGIDKPGRFTREGAVEDQLQVAPGKGFPDPLPNFLAAADISWEVDIWKRLRNAQRSAAMRYLGTRDGRNFVVTRLVAEIADNYYELLALDNRRNILDKTIEIQQRSLKVAIAKRIAGEGTELAVRRFQAEVRKNQSEQSVISQEIVEVENRINFLLGRYPQPVERITTNFVDLNINALSSGVPSQLLLNRSDIRQAEREVAAAGLDVKVARARFYPSLSLSAGMGWNAFATRYLFRSPESIIYGVAGEVVGPLINKRAIQADYATANAVQLQSIYDYQQTVLQAHIEVVNQITKIENYRRSIEDKKRQLESLQASVEAARLDYPPPPGLYC